MKRLAILRWKNAGWFARGIRRVQDSASNHAGIGYLALDVPLYKAGPFAYEASVRRDDAYRVELWTPRGMALLRDEA